jgi:protein-S-isoprenylcysteine O-methyltransferase Ste14
MKKTLVLLYGIINYTLGSAALVCLIAFLFNLIPSNPVLPNIDSDASTSTILALVINIGLMMLFALQHSVMARPGFKKRIRKFIPEAAERSTYMLATAIVAFTLLVFWRPMTGVVWEAENVTLHGSLLAIGLFGWALVFYATFLINHFDLFGLRQVWLYFRKKPYTQLPFKLNALYRYIRHPIMTGVFIGIWFTPVMTVGHLLFASGMSLYIVIGVYHEEKDLIAAFGERYHGYIQSTGKFLPQIGGLVFVSKRLFNMR